MNYQPQAKELAEPKSEHPWLTEVPGHCLQQALMDPDKVCCTHGTFRVHWRSWRRWPPSFGFPEGYKMVVEKLNRRQTRMKLPKLGWVKFRESWRSGGRNHLFGHVAKPGRHWYTSLWVNDGVAPRGRTMSRWLRSVWTRRGGGGCDQYW